MLLYRAASVNPNYVIFTIYFIKDNINGYRAADIH